MHFDRPFLQKIIEITGDEFARLSFQLHPTTMEMAIRIDWQSKNGKPHGYRFIRPEYMSQTKLEAEQFNNYVLSKLKRSWEQHQEECQQCA